MSAQVRQSLAFFRVKPLIMLHQSKLLIINRSKCLSNFRPLLGQLRVMLKSYVCILYSFVSNVSFYYYNIIFFASAGTCTRVFVLFCQTYVWVGMFLMYVTCEAVHFPILLTIFLYVFSRCAKETQTLSAQSIHKIYVRKKNIFTISLIQLNCAILRSCALLYLWNVTSRVRFVLSIIMKTLKIFDIENTAANCTSLFVLWNVICALLLPGSLYSQCDWSMTRINIFMTPGITYHATLPANSWFLDTNFG